MSHFNADSAELDLRSTGMGMGEARAQPQTLFFKAATGNAFTMVRAGFAFTVCILPKISFWQAFVAGLWRVLIMQRPGKVNFPLALTSLVARSAKEAMILPATACLSSNSSAIVLAIAPLVMALPVPFMTFIGAMAVSRRKAVKRGRQRISEL